MTNTSSDWQWSSGHSVVRFAESASTSGSGSCWHLWPSVTHGIIQPKPLQYSLRLVVTTRRLRISLTISIGLMKRNHGIDYSPVPVHAWSFLELGSAPLAIDHFVWLSHKHGTVFLPTSLHQLLYRLSRDNLKHFYLPNLSHHFKLLSYICVPCPRSYLAYATLISTFYY